MPWSKVAVHRANIVVGDQKTAIQIIRAGAESAIPPKRILPNVSTFTFQFDLYADGGAYMLDAQLLDLDGKLRTANGDGAGAIRDAEDLFDLSADTWGACGWVSSEASERIRGMAMALVVENMSRLNKAGRARCAGSWQPTDGAPRLPTRYLQKSG